MFLSINTHKNYLKKINSPNQTSHEKSILIFSFLINDQILFLLYYVSTFKVLLTFKIQAS